MKNLFLLLLLLSNCKKEYSCEACRDEIRPPKSFIVHYSAFVPNNQELSHIEPQLNEISFDIILKNDEDSIHTYEGSYDLAGWHDMNNWQTGDSLFFRLALVWMDRSYSYENLDTLIK